MPTARKSHRRGAGGAQPLLRAELFSTDQLEKHGAVLARLHGKTTQLAPERLLRRLNDNEEELKAACDLLVAGVAQGERVSPAGEWLLDNFHLVEEAIRASRRHLPKGYSGELPCLAKGPLAGFPRVYDIALETISHGDGRIDRDGLGRFIAAYQRITPLKLGELWAIPIMLRLALIENLRRIASHIAEVWNGRQLAGEWAELMTQAAESDPKSLILVIADMARSNLPMTTAFVAEIARRLQGRSPALALPLSWIEQRLAESGSTIELSVFAENQNQAATQVSISHSIGSLRLLDAIDWKEFVEAYSFVHQRLCADPTGTFVQMTFASRDRYRHEVEAIARCTPRSETMVAAIAMDMAREAAARLGAGAREAHVGYYLIDDGLASLEQRVGARRPIVQRAALAVHDHALPVYLGSIALLTAVFGGWALVHSRILDSGTGWLVAMAFPTAIVASQLAIALVNWASSLLALPHALPRMDFSRGVPPDCRTIVVVPCMLGSVEDVERMVEALEVRFLANRDAHLHFALLTDFRDASAQHVAGDDALVDAAAQGIEHLDRKYDNAQGRRFFLFHRERQWNPAERCWMGFERKRGKLAALNAALREGSTAGFARIVGSLAALAATRYVITLDADTQLPRDSARQFVGAMSHPLTRPVFDPVTARVREGYGILQPRVAVSLPGTNNSLYARLWGSDSGVDPYTLAVSDTYQDLFGEGSFIGKGIYDIDAFEATLAGRFPDNRVLSHDLIEGSYARAGLVSDVLLYEEYPTRYDVDVGRRHRWIRGDWQIGAWLRRRVPGAAGATERNTLSWLSQWKIFDNLRRSLFPVAVLTLLLWGWIASHAPGLWTLWVLAVYLVPPALASLVNLLRWPDETSIGVHLRLEIAAVERRFAQAAFSFACLPHEALSNLDAIVRTIWRVMVSKTRLLQWSPSEDAQRAPHASLRHYLGMMAAAPALALVTAAGLWQISPAAFAVAIPTLAWWFVAPLLAWWSSRPAAPRDAIPDAAQVAFLRRLARRTWAYFETFVGEEDHWLPPDNHQQEPLLVTAHRTSPTNMGLALLANLAAYDFGYMTPGRLVDRTARAFESMGALERHRGHFYNWYDTRTLKPLAPQYVSTVDSGNLAAHLLTLRPGLAALGDAPIFPARTFEGLRDTAGLLRQALGGDAASPVAQLLHELDAFFDARGATLAAVRKRVERLAATAARMPAAVGEDARFWAAALERQLHDTLQDLLWLAPWLDLPPAPARLVDATVVRTIPTLHALANLDHDGIEAFARAPAVPTDEESQWLEALRAKLQTARERAQLRVARIASLVGQAGAMASAEVDFLYDAERDLFAIGYNVSERRRDSGYYDLLASEARLASFVAIAQGQVPQENWFALGRRLTVAEGRPVLLSWSGSMFEYLMPLLVMPAYENTLLDQTARAAVDRQIAYGRERGVPWGISESGYNTVDAALNYQYRAFGVPGLGIQRGLREDLVVTPHASALALMVSPLQACANLERLAEIGVQGRYGMHEAIDYTPSRVARGQSSAIVRSYMTHHQGMAFLSFAWLLLGRPMQARFESDAQFKATMLLLQERIPKTAVVQPHEVDLPADHVPESGPAIPVRVIRTPDTPVPEVQLLSNGRYHVMVSSSGAGYSRWRDLAVTRWHEDATSESGGMFCYIRDVASGVFWSTAHQPTLKRATQYEAIFSDARAEFRRRDMDIDSHTEIVVSPEDDIELRRTRVTNLSRARRVVEVTSYAEVVLASAAADAMHPAFSNLFVQTEIVQPDAAILCTRRPRSAGEFVPWMFHCMSVHGAQAGEATFETDRARFIGRGRSVASPAAMDVTGALGGTHGSVLDPIVAIRRTITLDPDETAIIDIATGVADTRERCVELGAKYRDLHLADRVFDLAWTHSWVTLRQINAAEVDAQLYSRLAGSIIHANASLRVDPKVILQNRRGQSDLWGYAISGDLPIVLLQVRDRENIELVRRMVQAHAYWRLKGLPVDLVIWNEDHAGYRQALQDQILGLIAAGVEGHTIDRPGGIFVRPGEQISEEDRILFQSAARVIVTDGRGTLEEQLVRRATVEPRIERLETTRTHRPLAPGAVGAQAPEGLAFFNGHGGFAEEGREYVVLNGHGHAPPVPWVNVIANADFGTVVSDSGSSYTWSDNAHEFRLTPWHNDPVCDSGGEAFYVRDEESGHFWSPTPWPARGAAPYTCRHGFGYSTFEHAEDGLQTQLRVHVDLEERVKYTTLRVHNVSGRARRLSVTGYLEWVLGDLHAKSAMHVVTERDPATGALYARNAYHAEFGDRIAFFDVDATARSVTGDRTEFLGRNGSPRNPAALGRARLSNRVGAALDPCGAIQVVFDLADGEEREIVFRVGVAGREGIEGARRTVQRLRGGGVARAAFDRVKQYWSRTLGAVQVRTPDLALDLLANGWLTYQALACRLWARSGFYQSGGAFGFRDQLQDAMALVHSEPRLLRAHLLRCAGHQFLQGDVQHWWHPPVGRGVRTRCSDDYLWLVLAGCRYVFATGDTGVLGEQAAFLDGRPVPAHDDSYYDLPRRSETSATLYEHMVKALRHAFRYGAHGLPLMGAGDWNDGMNRVGIEGRGESVWLGFFLCEVLAQFAPLARLRGDDAFAAECDAQRAAVSAAIERDGWDGAWYRRAFFDDGTALGSAANAECRIDSIAQSWAVLSGVGGAARAKAAMDSLDANLVRRDAGLVLLLDPPFDRAGLDPGYIRGYVPGVRENGGQYTHAAIWAAMAQARLGDATRAWELFRLINPVNHALDAKAVATYKVEPYVVAADVYAAAPHTGRGGWSWYTGSAGWMYRLVLESLLGLALEMNRLSVQPCMPAHWDFFEIDYRFRDTLYRIEVRRSRGAGDPPGVRVDGIEAHPAVIALDDDRREHRVEVVVAARIEALSPARSVPADPGGRTP